MYSNNIKKIWIDAIRSKLKEKSAISLHDKELKRCLGGCIAKTKLIKYAKELRDSGVIDIKNI